MSDIVIQVKNISKYYRLGLVGTTTLKDDLDRTWAKLRGKPDPTLKIGQKENNNSDGYIWALKDISFEVKQGEILGIIGRNGAGKSTLLKILSRVTAPTTGECRVKGRIASLLEVGTGFHPELTGRQNIFLNGAILGMTKEEIRQKFDEIIEFSGVEKFIDTPVKRYSSGMYVRLAFGVAAHLEPEILIVDEVLAVGDAQFQKKCLGKMQDVGKEGRTVLFVSHQMGAISQLCNRALLLNNGEIVQTGSTRHVVNYYMDMSTSGTIGYEADTDSLQKDIAIIKAQTFNAEGNSAINFSHDEQIIIAITCKINNFVRGAELRISVRDSKRNVFTTDAELVTEDNHIPEELCAKVLIPAGLLRPGQYFFTLASYLPNQIIFHRVQDAFSVNVFDGGSKYAASEGLDYGCVFVDCAWTIEDVTKFRGNS